MRNLLLGIKDFRQRIRPSLKDVFKQLEKSQKPDTLFIACADSRVVPNLFASTNPGELFVIRNVGNIVTPCLFHNHHSIKEKKNLNSNEIVNEDTSVGAAIEFSNYVLNVKHIVVCGHSNCGAIKATVEGLSDNHNKMDHLSSWLKYCIPSKEKFQNAKIKIENGNKEINLNFQTVNSSISASFDTSLPILDQVSQINVLQQLEHLITYPIIKERLLNGDLTLHGWWFEIGKANVYAFSEKKQKFVLMDDKKVEELLERLEKNENEESSMLQDEPNWVKGLNK